MPRQNRGIERLKTEVNRSSPDAYEIEKARVFGSVSRGEDTEDSDLDIMVDIEPFTSLFAVARLQNELEELFPQIKIDLIDSHSFKDKLDQKINQEAVFL